ncbi:ABC transporter substrate-binding protein [Psychromarinibacter sp. C21-152]|uniref:ABC transporter substrate-binding protein n=1 Tax=Psychromarinibacter sediminicola TaxID=3033385 RepID=A0AAE3TA38_9RHOB|nr:ABC transporter substrate-binding protein [Psychromarinibacter sediminicola]MDF0603290.1 ABC transporter substrate-binding protein [Psychromarinibacter sediminicola]
MTAEYSSAQDVPQDERVLSVGGSVTEIVYALGEGDRLVARDTTSSYPEAAQDLPDVGYMRALTPEGVLSVNPDLVIAEAGSGPPETIDVLREAAIDFVSIPGGFDRESVRAKIEAVAAALDVPAEGARLAREIDAALAEAAAEAAGHDDPRRVLFILSTQGGRIMASGTGTAADGIIGLAGGENAITEFAGYKPLTDEAIIAAAPDVILMMQRGGDHSMPDEALFSLPAIASTPAGEAGALVRMDGLLLLGFGPRTPQAVRELNAALYGTD